MPTNPEYIIKADHEKRGQFVYSCTACDSILGVRKELETPDCIVDLLSGICPSCGAKLENSVDCRQGQVPEGWHNPIPSVDVTKMRRRTALLQRASSYNNNLGILLAAIFGNPLGSASSVKLTPTSGPAQTISVYTIGTIDNSYYIDLNPTPRADLSSGATGEDSAVIVGTGSASTCPG